MTNKIRTTPQNGMWVLLDTFSTSCSPISSMSGPLVVTRTRGMILGASGHYWPALILLESRRHGSHNGSKATTCFDILPRWYNRRMRGRNSSVGMKKHKKTLCSRIDWRELMEKVCVWMREREGEREEEKERKRTGERCESVQGRVPGRGCGWDGKKWEGKNFFKRSKEDREKRCIEMIEKKREGKKKGGTKQQTGLTATADLLCSRCVVFHEKREKSCLSFILAFSLSFILAFSLFHSCFLSFRLPFLLSLTS